MKAIRLANSADTWQAAINQAVYSYNMTKHSTTGFTPQFLHNGQQVAAPGLIYPDEQPPNPPVEDPNNKLKYATALQDVQKLLRGVVDRNCRAAQRRTARYYKNKTKFLVENTWVYVHRPGARPPEGDKLANRKLAIEWAGPYLFLRMENDATCVVAKMNSSGLVEREFKVHATKVRACPPVRNQLPDGAPPPIKPGELNDWNESAASAASASEQRTAIPSQLAGSSRPTIPPIRDEVLLSERGSEPTEKVRKERAQEWLQKNAKVPKEWIKESLKAMPRPKYAEPRDAMLSRDSMSSPARQAVKQAARAGAQRRADKEGRPPVPKAPRDPPNSKAKRERAAADRE